MAHLAKAACTLKFEEHEFVDFFSMVSDLDEDACSYTYSVRRDGLRLLFSMFPLEGRVLTELYREGVPEPIFKSRLLDCTHSRLVQIGTLRCMEIGRPFRPTSDRDASPSWGLRLYIEPQIRLEYIHEEG